jgi:hypothetical protein
MTVHQFVSHYRRARVHGRTRPEAVCYGLRWAGR